MKQTITIEDSIFYISESDFANFIVNNSDHTTQEAWDIIESSGIISDDGHHIIYNRNTVERLINDVQRKWIKAFFDAHPFMNKIIYVFTD